MAVRGLRLVKKYRGVVRSDMKSSLNHLNFLLSWNVKKSFMTAPEVTKVTDARNLLSTWLAEKIGV